MSPSPTPCDHAALTQYSQSVILVPHPGTNFGATQSNSTVFSKRNHVVVRAWTGTALMCLYRLGASRDISPLTVNGQNSYQPFLTVRPLLSALVDGDIGSVRLGRQCELLERND